ncbi:MAG: hypothetical protein K2F99_03640 [Muribaculaceae bacterium]|nr:hypothetical protein [Muribaculaceae bacterium]
MNDYIYYADEINDALRTMSDSEILAMAKTGNCEKVTWRLRHNISADDVIRYIKAGYFEVRATWYGVAVAFCHPNTWHKIINGKGMVVAKPEWHHDITIYSRQKKHANVLRNMIAECVENPTANSSRRRMYRMAKKGA